MSWARSGSGLLILLAAAGPGWSSCPHAGAKGVSWDRALATPLGVVVPGPRSIECIWGVWVWYRVHFCVSTCGAKVWIFVCVHEGGDICLCICVLVVYVYVSGRALDSASLIILVDPHPTTMPCRWRMPPVRWWFLAPGQDARASAGPLSGVDWRGLALLALLGPDCGVGGLWVSGPRGPVRPGMVGCRWSLRAAARHPGAPTLWLSEVPPSGSLRPFLGGGRGLSLRWFSWGSRALGVSGCLGPGSFLMPASCPCGMGLLFPTHTIKHLHGGTLWTQARSHTQVYTQAFTLV